ncbi:hypothetical protein [Nitrobacter sp.]|uniref:hypothetical protein n=1 Tax=Nitrobacter sp. TaxID=29420 RepID=UPI0029CABF37|nr:hypothetical protein [Nitrobacter sp.]
MFSKGEIYEVTMWVTSPEGGGHQASWTGRVVAVAEPLVKFADPSGVEVIVNTHSMAFVGAKAAEQL